MKNKAKDRIYIVNMSRLKQDKKLDDQVKDPRKKRLWKKIVLIINKITKGKPSICDEIEVDA